MNRPQKEPHQLASLSLLARILVLLVGLARCPLISAGRGSGPVLLRLLTQAPRLHPWFLTSRPVLLSRKQRQIGTTQPHCYVLPLEASCLS